ncbi:MAG: putative sugar nucleotidyl transferase [Planctomycetota bacterium]
MPSILLFEDASVAKLAPATLARPAFDVLCGGRTLMELLRGLKLPMHAIVRPHLRAVLAAHSPKLTAAPADGAVLLVNARLVPSRATLSVLSELLASPAPAAVQNGRAIAAAMVPAAVARGLSDLVEAAANESSAAGVHAVVENWLASADLPFREAELRIFDYPHDLLRHHPALLGEYLAERVAVGDLRQTQDGLFAATDAAVSKFIEADTAAGPVVVESGARVGPFCFLRGPVLIGRGAKVIEHAALKDGVTLGHTTKVGGEVEGSIIEPYSNKQHFGFLGHSYVGRWVNLGAGTTNSDLKNTYGTVTMRYSGEKVDTGMQFLGCFVGDYAKSAIHASIYTGKMIGFGSMLYGTVAADVPSFVNYARSLGQVTEVSPEVVVKMQSRMFGRRGLKQRECDAQLVRDVFELTRGDRDFPSGPPQL